MSTKIFHRILQFSLFFFISVSLSSCNLSAIQQLQLPNNLDLSKLFPPTATPSPEVLEENTTNTENGDRVEVTFKVQVPTNTPQNQTVVLKIMEEVTGLAFNAQRIEMESAGDQLFTYTLSVPKGTVLKYRYARIADNNEVQEHISDNRQVRYRMLYANAPMTVEDVVSRWTDTAFEGKTGRITGTVIDAVTKIPIPNILIDCGGVQTLTSSDGSFLIEGLLPGVHNLVAYALDGSYQTFQQGAKVETDSTTPAEIALQPAKLVGVVFVAKLPQNTIPAVPVRLAGNLYQLGNTFADLNGGISTIASRMPVLSLLPDGRYSINIALPAGADIHYLYTLGDGFWNTEVDENGKPNLRHFIVPDKDTMIEDSVTAWVTKDSHPISFDVTLPDTTPKDDFVSIQFRPIYGWTEPIPMWRLGDKRWGFILNSPLDFADQLHFRICRNNDCGIADASDTMGFENLGLAISSTNMTSPLRITVPAWAWTEQPSSPVELTTPEVTPREDGFLAGIEFQSIYHPSYNQNFSYNLDSIQYLSSNWLVMTPTWTFTRQSPPVLELVPGEDPLWLDMAEWLRETTDRGISTAIFPQPRFSQPISDWWTSSTRDFAWWQVWFERYRNFALYHADLATQNNANALILGGDWLSPAYPGGKLLDGSDSGVPADAEARWRLLIQEIKTHFKGPLFWAISGEQAKDPPPFLDAVDGIYLLWSEPMVSDASSNPSPADLAMLAGQELDKIALPLHDHFNKTVLLGVSYPSAAGVESGCIKDASDTCVSWDDLVQPKLNSLSVKMDLQAQVNLYNALFTAINSRTWISGLVSRGYYPAAALIDPSPSVRGKPAADLLSYWFSNLLAENEE